MLEAPEVREFFDSVEFSQVMGSPHEMRKP
jgi:hypothetical protein